MIDKHWKSCYICKMKRIITAIAIAACASAAWAGNNEDNMAVIAHRGGATLGAENTLSCIRKGILAGADAIEIDVHLSADGALVVCHDETIDRTTTGSGRIEEMTLAQIRSFGIKDDPAEKIPTLEEVLYEVKDKCPLLLEVKKSREGQYPMIEDKIVAMLDSLGMRGQVMVQSFNDSVLERMHLIAPDIPLGKLLVCRLPFGLAVDTGLRRFSLDDYSYVNAVNPNNSLTTKRFIRDVHEMGKSVFVWTVDKPSKVKSGVDAVITNSPQLFTGKEGN